MKTSLEKEDISAIASCVMSKITPLLGGGDKQAVEDSIFTPETLAHYLKVETSWVYRQVSDKTIPYFKSGKYVRFRKTSIDKWITSNERQPVPKFQHFRCSKTAS